MTTTKQLWTIGHVLYGIYNSRDQGGARVDTYQAQVSHISTSDKSDDTSSILV